MVWGRRSRSAGARSKCRTGVLEAGQGIPVSRKRGKQRKAAVEAVPEDVLAEGSGPVNRVDTSAITTVEDVVTTDDIATTEDVVTADDVVATTTGPSEDPAHSSVGELGDVADAAGADAGAAEAAGADAAGLEAASDPARFDAQVAEATDDDGEG